MITGFLGIAYSTDEIKDGKFIDKTLEVDFLQARYDILRRPDRMSINESVWRRNGEEARREFLQMMDAADRRNKLKFDESESDLDSSTFTYVGDSDVPTKIETLIIGQEVEEIPAGLFKDQTSLKSIVFNEGLRRIGDNAFENCSGLTNVRLNGISYIGDEAFQNCTGLVSIELGSDVQHIGMGAFKNCTELAAISIPPNVTFIGDYAFANCSKMKTAMVMDGVVEVPAYGFQNCVELEQTILPTSIEKVGERAFENCPNVEVYVPTMDMAEAEELLGVKMVAKAENDDTLLKTDQDYMVRLYKDLF